ncbi:cation diffusion facilitator family transporter [Alicyclobacillus sp. SO9]|uniref:cation diffusion facilitator family transporter n=1 Tax=Alicyclobacillus sp. SO9 TaxID=2665646 RepID=UPI0018E81F7D|nr:cation diffusion facilitator family transporter [Alicyclobacillus sp. SO9]QQE77451.1 cation transporter [Alicyclobacillus sp. SO9]
MDKSQQRQIQLAAAIGTIANIVLTIGKAVVGHVAGSRALLADAVHSGADVVGSIAVMIGLKVARKPPDADHPYGHGRAELVSSAVVALVLLVAGIEVFIASIKGLFAPPHAPEAMAAYVAAASIVVKEILYQYNVRLGRRFNSHSLVASAKDHRTDVYASIAALIGIVLSIAGRVFHIHWLKFMDSIAGAGVALVVVFIGYQIVADVVQSLMDRVEVRETNLEKYYAALHKIKGVERVDDLRIRDHGQFIVVDVEIGVDAQISVEQGHEVAERVKTELRVVFPRIVEVLVHVNPYYPETP